ncbi:MAG TPA: hypothetical protein VJA18_00540 [Candidatus Nanoarchaeia archaeon]|nr:hypothetical protein [Candidatus Nanoarchaeia archaeon]
MVKVLEFVFGITMIIAGIWCFTSNKRISKTHRDAFFHKSPNKNSKRLIAFVRARTYFSGFFLLFAGAVLIVLAFK